jgi:hypothetical protein
MRRLGACARIHAHVHRRLHADRRSASVGRAREELSRESVSCFATTPTAAARVEETVINAALQPAPNIDPTRAVSQTEGRPFRAPGSVLVTPVP